MAAWRGIGTLPFSGGRLWALITAVAENAKHIMLPLHKGAYKYYREKGAEVPKAAPPID